MPCGKKCQMAIDAATPYLAAKNVKGYSENALKQIGRDLLRFDETDKDKSGSLDRDEIKSMLEKEYLCSEWGHGFASDQDVTDFLQELDDDGNGRIDKEEFIQKIVLRWANAVYIRQLIKYDKDRSGLIKREELYQGLTDDGYSQQDLSDFIDKHGLDQGGKVDFKLFLKTFFDINRQAA